jgi:hypothetical protein
LPATNLNQSGGILRKEPKSTKQKLKKTRITKSATQQQQNTQNTVGVTQKEKSLATLFS